MSNITDSDFNKLKKEIMKRHLEQLQGLDLSVPINANPRQKDDPVPLSYDQLVKWTNASKAQLDKGINNKVYGGPFGSEIDFNNAFVAFMESAAMYLRDDSLVAKAVDAHRSNKNSEEAFQLLEASVSDIVKLLHPDGQSLMVGPFCGAFISKNRKTSDTAVIGVAFKA
ncbi:hypothetical protein Clacol_008601 [Clathrus columnatus]|uniref:Uncharacterized protein n=1 Tax=Clathrus columnatus TaxID=1419009 RepID=A0AAV5AKZ0_9AGAM|nr:hypothetical protein Clacol_008601 [Clathrus columnatus]